MRDPRHHPSAATIAPCAGLLGELEDGLGVAATVIGRPCQNSRLSSVSRSACGIDRGRIRSAPPPRSPHLLAALARATALIDFAFGGGNQPVAPALAVLAFDDLRRTPCGR
jgi:hypothetical protein